MVEKKNSTVYPFDDHFHLVWISVYVVLLINKDKRYTNAFLEYKVFHTKKDLKEDGYSAIILIIVKHIEKILCWSLSTTEQNNLISERKKDAFGTSHCDPLVSF